MSMMDHDAARMTATLVSDGFKTTLEATVAPTVEAVQKVVADFAAKYGPRIRADIRASVSEGTKPGDRAWSFDAVPPVTMTIVFGERPSIPVGLGGPPGSDCGASTAEQARADLPPACPTPPSIGSKWYRGFDPVWTVTEVAEGRVRLEQPKPDGSTNGWSLPLAIWPGKLVAAPEPIASGHYATVIPKGRPADWTPPEGVPAKGSEVAPLGTVVSTAEQARIAAGCDALIAGAGNRDHVKAGTWWRNTLDGERRQVLEVHAHGVQLACNGCGTGELVRWSQFLPRFEPANCPPPPVPSAWYSPVTNELWVVEAVVGLGPILSHGPGLFELQCVPWADWPRWKPASRAAVPAPPVPPTQEP